MSEPIRIGPPDEEIYGPSPRELPTWERFRKYTKITAYTEQDVADTYTTWKLSLVVGNQSFSINGDIVLDGASHAEWFADRLARALERLVENEVDDAQSGSAETDYP